MTVKEFVLDMLDPGGKVSTSAVMGSICFLCAIIYWLGLAVASFCHFIISGVFITMFDHMIFMSASLLGCSSLEVIGKFLSNKGN